MNTDYAQYQSFGSQIIPYSAAQREKEIKIILQDLEQALRDDSVDAIQKVIDDLQRRITEIEDKK